jgi:hypothetical protein
MIQPKLPEYDYSLVIRTDFSNDTAWEQLCRTIQEPQTQYGFQASVEFVNDASCSGLAPEAVASVLPPGSHRSFAFLVDDEAITKPDHPILVVDLEEGAGRTFRVVPSEAWSVENNLRLANMEFAEFACSVDSSGVFRGFPGAPT